MMEEWEHFNRLQDDGYIGKTNFFQAVCKHCQKAHDDAPAEKKSALVPERMVGRREKMRKHLSLCPHFKGELPHVERRVVVRSAAQLAFLPISHQVSNGGVNPLVNAESSVSSAAVAAAAMKQADGNSRLALDEWQYFTRLDRKKDSAYYFARCNFCQTAFENAPETLKASMEPIVVVGRKANMQTHLSKCPHVPRDMLITSSSEASPLSMDGGVVIGGAFNFSRDDHGYPATKRMRIGTRDDSAPALDSTGLYSSLLEFTIQHRLPFEWTESDSTKKLFRVMPTPEMEALLPTADELRGQVLTGTYEHILNSELLLLKEQLPVIATSTSDAAAEPQATSSSWPLMLHVTASVSADSGGSTIPELECTLTNGKAQVPATQIIKKHVADEEAPGMEDIPAIAHFHGLEVARWVDSQMRRCIQLEKIVPAVVVVPYSSVFQRAVGILRARWPRIAFVSDFHGMLLFCIGKVVAVEEVRSLVATLAEIWQIDEVRLASPVANPFGDWQACSLFMQSLVDEGTLFTSNVALKEIVDGRVSRALLERVSLLFRTFSAAYESCLEKHLGFADVVRFMGILFHAADGFESIQRALEVVWSEMEQPLYILAHVLHPHMRLGDMASTELTKLSKLSDLGVTYFADFFERRASSLRGEMTAYLHTSQPVFARTFVSEFPVLDDYFRYLSDDYASLSVLMRLVYSFSTVRSGKAESKASRAAGGENAQHMYTAEERRKIAYVIERCNIELIGNCSSGRAEQQQLAEVGATSSGESILVAWSRALQATLSAIGVDFALLDKRYESDDGDDGVSGDSGTSESSTVDQASDHHAALPSQETDDEVTYPSRCLRGDRAKKVSLKELFKPVEATI